MSQNLYWEPVKPQRGKALATGLKWAIQREYLSDHGSGVELGAADVGFLKGVKAASGSDTDMQTGVDDLIEAIHKYGAVRVFLA